MPSAAGPRKVGGVRRGKWAQCEYQEGGEIEFYFGIGRGRKQRWLGQTEEEAGPLRLCWSELIHSICSQHLSPGPGLEGLAREDHARVEH